MSDPCDHAPTPSYEQALARCLSVTGALPAEVQPLMGSMGCVLAEPVLADRDQPPFDRAMMDGYAVRSAQVRAGTEQAVVATLPAGGPEPVGVEGSAGVAAIATGAPVPRAYDAVVPIEQAVVAGDRVRFLIDRVEPGRYIHRCGSDARVGDVLIEAGTELMPQHVGIAAAAGVVSAPVIPRPGVSVLTTGDEVRPPATPGSDLLPHQIRNANGTMLDALLMALGAERYDHLHVMDDPVATRDALREASEKSDVVITVGGVSVGARDYLPAAIEASGFEVVVRGAAIQPGRPILMARARDGSGRVILGLPGNPVSVLATVHLFVWPVLRLMSGKPPALPWREVTLAESVKPNPKREAFRCAGLGPDEAGPARMIGWQNSGDLAHSAAAAGFVRLPARDSVVAAGERVPFLPLIGRAP